MNRTEHRPVVIVGSGFGGAMAARTLVDAGVGVLLLERGSSVPRGPEAWEAEGTIMRSPAYLSGPAFDAETDRGGGRFHAYSCVGGPSVFYGGVSLRFRAEDFEPPPQIVNDSGAEWPFDYRTLAPYYDRAERILAVAGRAGDDPTEPPRTGDYPVPPAELSEVSSRIADAGRGLGLRPFRLPLAINYDGTGDRDACIECDTCDTFACAIRAKNDLEVQVLRRLVDRGLELRAGAAVVDLLMEGGRVVGVESLDVSTGTRSTVMADRVILAGGALGSAQLLLASGAHEHNPAGSAVGRYLTRHCSAIVFGAYGWIPRYEGRFHKQVGFNDFYHGDPSPKAPPGPLGTIQQTQTPSPATIRGELHPLLVSMIAPLARRITGLLVIAEDQPRKANRVTLNPDAIDACGLPELRVRHRYSDRDLAARRALVRRARQIHQAGGAFARYTHVIDTFSHALGTVRMGQDARTSPLDAHGRFRGLAGLYVTDGSALPTSAGVNPSLTIAANALRIGEVVAEELKTGVQSDGG